MKWIKNEMEEWEVDLKELTLLILGCIPVVILIWITVVMISSLGAV